MVVLHNHQVAVSARPAVADLVLAHPRTHTHAHIHTTRPTFGQVSSETNWETEPARDIRRVIDLAFINRIAAWGLVTSMTTRSSRVLVDRRERACFEGRVTTQIDSDSGTPEKETRQDAAFIEMRVVEPYRTKTDAHATSASILRSNLTHSYCIPNRAQYIVLGARRERPPTKLLVYFEYRRVSLLHWVSDHLTIRNAASTLSTIRLPLVSESGDKWKSTYRTRHVEIAGDLHRPV